MATYFTPAWNCRPRTRVSQAVDALPEGVFPLAELARFLRVRTPELEALAGKRVEKLLVRQVGRAVARRVSVVDEKTAEWLITAIRARQGGATRKEARGAPKALRKQGV